MLFLERIVTAGRMRPVVNGDEYDAVNTVSTKGELETDHEAERLKHRRNAVDHIPSITVMQALSTSQRIR